MPTNPPPDFCAINRLFDSALQGYVVFQPGVDYVLRLIATGWETGTPAPYLLLPLARQLGGMLAATNDCGGYQLKGVLFDRAPAGDAVPYYEPHVLASTGVGCNSSLVADDGTWTIDLVFRSLSGETSYTAVQRWKAYAAAALRGTRGTPLVYAGGLVPLAEYPAGEQDTSAEHDAFVAARAFWAAVEPYYEYLRVADTSAGGKGPYGTGYGFQWRQVSNRAPATAWIVPSRVGTNGVGIALGDAFMPASLIPLDVAGTVASTPGSHLPPDQPNSSTPDYTQPGWMYPGLPGSAPQAGWAALSTGQRALGVGVGALAGLAFARLVMRW